MAALSKSMISFVVMVAFLVLTVRAQGMTETDEGVIINQVVLPDPELEPALTFDLPVSNKIQDKRYCRLYMDTETNQKTALYSSNGDSPGTLIACDYQNGYSWIGLYDTFSMAQFVN